MFVLFNIIVISGQHYCFLSIKQDYWEQLNSLAYGHKAPVGLDSRTSGSKVNPLPLGHHAPHLHDASKF